VQNKIKTLTAHEMKTVNGGFVVATSSGSDPGTGSATTSTNDALQEDYNMLGVTGDDGGCIPNPGDGKIIRFPQPILPH
jgi:hypothetical protein